MKVCFVLGTAPELIKIFPLLVEADRRKIQYQLITTGQSPVAFLQQTTDFKIPADRIREAHRALSEDASLFTRLKWLTSAVLLNPRRFINSAPDFLIVQGDSLTAALGAWWGRRLRVKVVHVEAGLRSGRLFSPFPQELCRRSISRLADLHFAPDDPSADNLRRRGLSDSVYSSAGNTLADAISIVGTKDSKRDPFVLASLSRIENIEHPLRWPFLLETLAKAAQSRKVFVILHGSLRRRLQADHLLMEKFKKAEVEFVPRLPFTKFIELVAHADYVITDGGSSQEECHYLGVPCLLLRETTERAEGLHSNCSLAKFDAEAVDDFISDPGRWRRAPAKPAWSPSLLIWDTLGKLAGGPTAV